MSNNKDLLTFLLNMVCGGMV